MTGRLVAVSASDLAAFLDATRHYDGGEDLDKARARLERAMDAVPRNPWIPLDPDGLPPRTYPYWRAQEAARRGITP